MSYQIKFEDNSNKFKGEWKDRKNIILYAWGLFLQGTITQILTRQTQVISGRLRASLTFITPDKQGKSKYSSPDSSSKDFITGKAEENSLIIGSNVAYAQSVELNSKKGPYIKPGILDYKEDLKSIVKTYMDK